MSFDADYFNRRTRNIFEDYDLHLYADPDGYASISGVPGDPNAADSLFLGYDYFGHTDNPGSNFVLGTLKGGKRNFQGLEFVFRKRFANNWQVLSSYNWNDGKGNSNSDATPTSRATSCSSTRARRTSTGRSPGSSATS